MGEAIPLAIVTLIAAGIQGVFGFGFTLVSISLFVALVGATAIPLLLIINLVITCFLAVLLWRAVPGKLWSYLIAGSVVGLPLGMVAFQAANVVQLQIAVGMAVVVFACLVWFRMPLVPANMKEDASSSVLWPLGVGGLSGFLATSLGMPGPLLMLFLMGLNLEKDVMRGTAICFLAVNYGAALAFHARAVTFAPSDILVAGMLIPIAAVGAWGGHVLSPRITYHKFRHALLVLIALSGAYTIASAMI